MKDNQLNNLFESVRDQSPAYSYEAIEQSFLASAAVAQPSSVLEKISKLSNTTKIIIMISTIATLATIITLFATSLDSKEKEPKSIPPQKTNNYTVVTDNKGEVKTTYYNEKKEVILVERSDQPIAPPVAEVIINEVLFVEETIETPPVKVEPKIVEESIEPTDSVSGETTRTTFVISHNINDMEMLKIKKAAKKVGVNFSYNILVWNGKVKRCNFWIDYDNGECSKAYASTLKGRKFAKTIGWITDSNGKAIDIIVD